MGERQKNYLILGSMFTGPLSLEALEGIQVERFFEELFTGNEAKLERIKREIILYIDRIEDITTCARALQIEFEKRFELCVDAKYAVPLWGSYYLDGALFGESMQWVDEFYRHCGYQVKKVKSGQPRDHLADAFGFLAIMGNENIAEQSYFLKNYLLIWLERMAKSKNYQSMHSLYRLLLDFAIEFVRIDEKSLEKG
jgi:hypothetical protein